MKTTDLLTQWSALSLEEIETQLASPEGGRTARKVYGVATVRALQAAPRRAAIGPAEPVVLLPGIMGPLLASIRGVTALLWINPALFLEGKSNYLELNADTTGDADPMIEATPVSIEKIFYLKISLILRREAQLFEFPYDWRRPIEHNADVLASSLERWATGNPDRKFTLLGHSMGGIVARAYLTRHPRLAERRVKRVISLGTPYFGAAGAVENMINGNDMMALAQALNNGNAPQQMLLSFPSVYQLLPAPADLFPASRPYPANWDLYRASEWRWPAIRQDYLDLARRSTATCRTSKRCRSPAATSRPPPTCAAPSTPANGRGWKSSSRRPARMPATLPCPCGRPSCPARSYIMSIKGIATSLPTTG